MFAGQHSCIHVQMNDLLGGAISFKCECLIACMLKSESKHG
jgi:hypothetical protein